ncbi:MAG: hypothetical protein LAO20_00715 [Acidobacteriia bacterium]|nr:hypothetical protein [Terriglobia bacterium]
MSRPYQYFSALLLTAALAAPVMTTGCTWGYRIHDRAHNDYHRWNSDEDRYYRQWEVEVRLPHRDIKDRDQDDQRRYWDWRHSHSDQDRDKGKNRDRDKDKDRR